VSTRIALVIAAIVVVAMAVFFYMTPACGCGEYDVPASTQTR
jgi:hypothetical protein